MSRSAWSLLRSLTRRLPADGEPLPDADLLRRFAADRDQAAFEVLVWRHGGMVLGVCRRLLRDEHAAEDAFQATFLILARKAGSVRGNVAGWLHRVARRVAIRASKRTKYERLTADPPGLPTASSDAELAAILDAEIDRLPDRFRLPVVLCYLDGRRTEDAAKLLGVPRGTVLSRLATARQTLAARLTRRGVTLPASGMAVTVTAEQVTASVSAAGRFVAGGLTGGTVQLANEVLYMGVRKQVIGWAAVLVATAGLGTGVGLVAQTPSAQPNRVDPPAAPVKQPTADKLPIDKRRQALAERMTAVELEYGASQKKLAQLRETVTRLELPVTPTVARAMGEVLVQVELYVFQAEHELAEAKAQADQFRIQLKQAETAPLDPARVEQARPQTEEEQKLKDDERAITNRIQQVQSSAVNPEKLPALVELRKDLQDVQKKRSMLAESLRQTGERRLREMQVKEVQDKVDLAQATARSKKEQATSLRLKADRLIQRLNEADRLKPDLEAALSRVRFWEMEVNDLRRLAIRLDQNTLTEQEKTDLSNREVKWESLLRAVTDLQREVRQLREERK